MIQIETTSHDPFFNQAFEDYVFRTFREDEVLLLWRNCPAVVVGCYQNICREVHVRALLEQNIPVVRRMSGGGTVYHDLGNLNYTLITGQSDGAGALAEGPVHSVLRYRLRHRGRGLHRDRDSPHAAGARRAVSVCLRDRTAR